MEKRYQVFVSSTFRDLEAERQSVLRAVLELDHMPAGMELFPAGDEAAWQLIRDVIDASDYYVLIVGGRYGSLDEAGLGYTEKEYDYALSAHKPVIPLLHENPDNLPRDKTETDATTWTKLKAFRAKVEKRHTCVYWTTHEDLKAKVIVGLTSAMKRHPAIGWVRADKIPTDSTLADVLVLRQKVSELEAQALADKTRPPGGTEELAQGEDDFDLSVKFDASGGTYDVVSYTGKISATWNEIFAAVAPSLINEVSDGNLRDAFEQFFSERSQESFSRSRKLKDKELRDFEFKAKDLDTCIVQLRALGLIQESQRQRSLRHTGTYWALTRYGDYLMTQLRALRRSTPKEPTERAIEEAQEIAD